MTWMRNPNVETHYKEFMADNKRTEWLKELPDGNVERLYTIPLFTRPPAPKLVPLTFDELQALPLCMTAAGVAVNAIEAFCTKNGFTLEASK